MHRFKVSKYKNAVPKTPKREGWLTDLNIGALKSCHGNHIKASCSFMAFNVDASGGSCVGVLPVGDTGRKDSTMPLVHAHSGFVTDMDWSPFNDGLLATCSYDCSVRLWQIPEGGLTESLSTPLASLSVHENRVENVLFHPAASHVLASTSSMKLKIWDLQTAQEKYNLDCPVIQGMSWNGNGSLLVTSCKDKKMRMVDPRCSKVVMEGAGLQGTGDCRVLCLNGNTDGLILGTGFSRGRERQAIIWDTHNLSRPLENLDLDSSTGVLMPFFDPDTNMLFLAGKGDSTILYFEVGNSEPYFKRATPHMAEEQTKGVAMVPKRALNVMSGEVVRLLQLTKYTIVPVSYIVPRKTYKDYHADLYPDTAGGEPAMTAGQWFDGADMLVAKVSLDPSVKPAAKAAQSAQPAQPSLPVKPKIPSKPESSTSTVPTAVEEVENKAATPSPNDVPQTVNEPTPTEQEEPVQPETVSKTPPVFTGVRVSKFRHLHGVPMHKSNNIDNVRNLSMSTFGDCDGLQVNHKFVAYLLSGPGGQVAALQLKKPCRLPDCGMPVIQTGSTVMDFVLNPFDEHQLAVANESGVVTLWNIPSEGLTEIIDKPSCRLVGHNDKPNIVRYHPTASNVLTSAAYDMTLKLWDLNKGTEVVTLTGHSEQVFGFAWSSDGQSLASVCRDKKLRVFDPRSQATAVQDGCGPEGSRGARVLWCGLNNEWILVSGFNKECHRCLSLYDSRDISQCLSTVEVNAAPSILIPFYDEDSSTVLLTAKGDTTIFAYEISEEPPHIFELSHYRAQEPYQAVGFQDKRVCNVRDVEFARAVKLTKTTVDFIKFQVPRVKMEYFQDDLFPDTRVAWEPSLDSSQWFAGRNKEQKRISMKPPDMKPLSEAPKEVQVQKKYDSRRELDEFKTDEQKKAELLTAMVNKMGNYDEPLPQDLQEGVDEDEWDDY